MNITLESIGKRFGQQWVFKNFSYQFEVNKSYVIVGPNGSGKSTLALLLVGFDSPTCGYIKRQLAVKSLPVESLHRHIAFSAPYLQLAQELCVEEVLRFALGGGVNDHVDHVNHGEHGEHADEAYIQSTLEEAQLTKNRHLPVAQLSSGMQQRLKLLISFEKNRPLLLLDEPTAHLDRKGKKWLYTRIEQEKGKRTLIICSQEKKDLPLGEKKICL